MRAMKVANTNVLTIYAIRNDKGEWLRSTGFGGYGKHWVPELARARLYAKIGHARGRVTTWANLYPKLPVPKIYAFSMNIKDAVIMDETARVKETRVTQAITEAGAQKAYADRQLKLAEEEAAEANRRVKDLRRKADKL